MFKKLERTDSTGMEQVWENEIYSKGRHFNRYPFDVVVSFIYRWGIGERSRAETRILEVGCGAGNNLWFAAREGFSVAGIDASPSAIGFAKQRFMDEGIQGDLRCGDFVRLPWENESFDLGIDRCSLVCVGRRDQQNALAEMRRVLRPGGLFFFNCYSDDHASAGSGQLLEDGRVSNIQAGTLVGVGALCFNSRRQIESLFSVGWEILKMEHLSLRGDLPAETGVHTEWRVVTRKR